MEQIKASSEWELTVTCAGCDTVVPTASCQSNLPEAGIIFPFANLGYYDGFSDDCEDRPDEEWEGKFPMCHDCTVKILDAVPALQAKIVKRYGRGLHQSKNKNQIYQKPIEVKQETLKKEISLFWGLIKIKY